MSFKIIVHKEKSFSLRSRSGVDSSVVLPTGKYETYFSKEHGKKRKLLIIRASMVSGHGLTFVEWRAKGADLLWYWWIFHWTFKSTNDSQKNVGLKHH